VVGRVSVGGGGGVETVALAGTYSTACWPPRVTDSVPLCSCVLCRSVLLPTLFKNYYSDTYKRRGKRYQLIKLLMTLSETV